MCNIRLFFKCFIDNNADNVLMHILKHFKKHMYILTVKIESKKKHKPHISNTQIIIEFTRLNLS